MQSPQHLPLLIFVVSFVALWIAVRVGAALRRRYPQAAKEDQEDFSLLVAATLTLLALIIGFTFSMAISRYDLRKHYEAEEANAIGTEYTRTSLLPAGDAAKVRTLLVDYLDQRILFYNSRDKQQLREINTATARLQDQMWSVVAAGANAQPTIILNLALAGMNDVLNAQGYTQAAWWNRIPSEAWLLLILIAILCNLMVGYAAHRKRSVLFLVLPLMVSISLAFIADIDSPRGGAIRVHPQNLESLAESLHAH